jgi:hypothetical protein
MCAESFAELPAETPVPLPVPGPVTEGASRVHLVVVRSRPQRDDAVDRGLLTRYWHPGRRRWVEDSFESLEHVVRFFVDENGWAMRQQQVLGRPGAHELIFEARPGELDRPSAKEVLLEEVGLSPEDAEEMLDRVDDQGDGG